MKYCKDAVKLLGKNVVCGRGCPIYGIAGKKCPRLILEDATDSAIEKAILAMMEVLGSPKVTG